MSALAKLSAPADWPFVPLGACVFARQERGAVDLPLLSVSADNGVLPRPEDGGRAASEDLAQYRVVRPGDLVVNRLVAREGAFGVASTPGLVSPAYWVLSPREGVVSEYLDCLLRSPSYLAEIRRCSKDMPPAQFDWPWDQAKKLPILLPPVDIQREIAEFLRSERKRVARLLTELDGVVSAAHYASRQGFQRWLEKNGIPLPQDPTLRSGWHLPPEWRIIKLGLALTELTNGYVGPTRDLLVDEGVRYLRSSHIQDARIDFDRRPYFVPYEWFETRPRIQVKAGDVLIVQTGNVGQSALVPEGFGDAACHSLLIARANPRLLRGDFLAAFLQSHIGREAMRKVTTGALHPGLEAGEIRQIFLPLPPLAEQRSIAAAHARALARFARLESEVASFATALREVRSALLHEVTGGNLSRLVVPARSTQLAPDALATP